MMAKRYKPIKWLFKKSKTTINRTKSIIGRVCDESEELFVKALKADSLLLMKHPEEKNRILLVKGISAYADNIEVYGPTGQFGLPVAMDPVNQEVFGVQITSDGIVLHHLGYFSGAYEDHLPQLREYAKKYAKSK